MAKKFSVTATSLNIRSGPGTAYAPWGSLARAEVVEEVETAGWCPILMEDDTIGWVARGFLQEVQEEMPAQVPVAKAPPAAGQETPWMAWVRSKLGLAEVPGAGDNPEIVSWFALTTLPQELWHDATAWCAVFFNAAVIQSGGASLKSARVMDYLQWGHATGEPYPGCAVIFQWSNGEHHIACFVKWEPGNKVRVIGGNQSNAVTEAVYPQANVLGYREPL